MNCNNNAIYNLLSPITEESPSTRLSSSDGAPPRRFTSNLHGSSFVRPEPYYFPYLHLDDDDDEEGYLNPGFDTTEHGSYQNQSHCYREQWCCHDDNHAAAVSQQPLVAASRFYPYTNRDEHGLLQRVDPNGPACRSIMLPSDSFHNSKNAYTRRHPDRPPQDQHWVTDMDLPSYHNHAFAPVPVSEIHIVDDDDCHVSYQYKDEKGHWCYPNPTVYFKEPPPVFHERSPSTSRVVYMQESASLFPAQSPQRHYSDNIKPAATAELTTSATAGPIQVEVVPGVWLRLRGAVETQQAVQDGFFIATDCPCCTTTLCCIANADYVVCPDCRVVSSIHDYDTTDVVGSNGGVGLGLKFADYIS